MGIPHDIVHVHVRGMMYNNMSIYTCLLYTSDAADE